MPARPASGPRSSSPSGFGEVGDEGGQSQAELVRIARRHGIRLVGPNCLGVLNTDPRCGWPATFSPVLPPAGGLALASQSGAIGIAVLDHAARTGAGISSFVSLGNKADVSGNDLLSYWFDDPATTRGRAVPGVVRQPAPLRPDRPGAGPAQAGASLS